MKNRLLLISTCFIMLSNISSAQIRVGEINIERHDAFEPTDKDWFFASSFLNLFHTKTKSYIIEDELLFQRNDLVDDELLLETERNLRATGLFTNVRIELDSVRDDTYDVYLVTKDRWSLYPAILFGSGGGSTNYGLEIEEYNLFGSGTIVAAEALYRNESNIGWQGEFEISQRRFLRSNLSLNFKLLGNRIRTEQRIDLARKYLTLDAPMAYGVSLLNQFGRDFLFIDSDKSQLLKLDEKIATAWFSRAWWRKDRVFFTTLVEYHNTDREKPEYERAYDNSGKLLFAFSSVSQDFFVVKNVNSYFPEDVSIGGWGSAVLGKVFPIGSKGRSFYYVAGQGERSYLGDNFYVFGQLTGASAFAKSNSYYTYQEFLGLGYYKLFDNLLFAGRIRQIAVWNWYAMRQLILDTDTGLRGYNLNSLSGDNRIISNFEFRYFPNLEAGMFNFSGVAFMDLGSVWDQSLQLSKAKFHTSAGLGLRIHFNKSDNPRHIFRIDFAHNFDEGKFGGIVFSIEQMFSAFQSHDFRLPQLFGLEFDYE